METGIKAWLANCDSDTRIDLPGGWHWDVAKNKTGMLRGPGNEACVGYNIGEQTIRFGADGQTTAHGLNLWTVQEMGEKFARENFMDDATAAEYDKFAAERMNKRRDYERGVRSQMSGVIQLELKEGKWTAHVDTEAVATMTNMSVIAPDSELSMEKGVALFNKMSEARNVMPLRDPLGYMTLEGNTYNYIKEQYEFQYDDTIQNIDAGFINGNGRGCEAILDKLDAVVRKNVREYCLPDGVNYQDLRYVKATPEIKDAVDHFVKQRVTQTVNYEKKRSHSPESLLKDHDKFIAAGETLRETIGEAVLAPMELPLMNENVQAQNM